MPTPGQCAALACALEVYAQKPGNVHRYQSFPELSFHDFIKSALAIQPVIERAAGRPIGLVVLECIQATRRRVSTNTNLGIVLLLAPLAVVPVETDLERGVRSALQDTTIDDAVQTYRAIRLAEPGGLGAVQMHDVANEPTVSLREVMDQAADRDSIARQYVTNFTDVFDAARWFSDQWNKRPQHAEVAPDLASQLPLLENRIVNLYFRLLAQHPDSLVRRKRGEAEAGELQRLAARLIASRKDEREVQLAKLNDWFASAFPHRNPGATADLVCASLFVALRTGMISLPPLPPDMLEQL